MTDKSELCDKNLHTDCRRGDTCLCVCHAIRPHPEGPVKELTDATIREALEEGRKLLEAAPQYPIFTGSDKRYL